MNILFLTHHFQTPDQPGAPRPWKVAKFLKDRGHNVTVITAGVQYMTGKLFDEVKGHLWIKQKSEGLTIIKTYAIPNYRTSLKKRIISYLIYSFCAFLSGLGVKKLDIVLTATTPPFVTAGGYVLSKIKHARFVIEVRELFPEEAVELGYIKSSFLTKIMQIYQRFFRKRADKIVALTPGIREILINKRVEEDKIDVIPNAYDEDNNLSNVNLDKNNAKKRFGWDPNFIVLYAGGFGQVNELLTLVRAAQLLRSNENIKFVLIGAGEREKEYKHFCKEKNLLNCYFLSARPKKEMFLFYKSADACIQLTPKGEFWKCVLSNKIFDYLGNGCPVVFAGTGDTADLLEKANAGLVVEPENPEALAEAILYLYNHPEKRKEMGENGFEYIRKHYSRDRLLKKLEDMLLEVAAGKNPATKRK